MPARARAGGGGRWAEELFLLLRRLHQQFVAGVLGWGILLPSNFAVLLPRAGRRHHSSQPTLALGRIRPRVSSSLSGFAFTRVLWGGQRGGLASTYLRTPPPPLPPPPGSVGRQLSTAPSPMPAPPASSHGTGGCPAQCRGAQLSHRRGGSTPSASLWDRHNITHPTPHPAPLQGTQLWGKQEEDGLDHQGFTIGTAMQKQTMNTQKWS